MLIETADFLYRLIPTVEPAQFWSAVGSIGRVWVTCLSLVLSVSKTTEGIVGILIVLLFNLRIGDNWFFIIFIMKSTTFLQCACIGMVPNMVMLMFIPIFNHICIAMITLGVINYRNFSYRCIFYIWMIMSTVFLNTLYTCRIGMIPCRQWPYMDMVRHIKFNHIRVGKTICCKLGGQRNFWKYFSLRHFGQLCILSIPDAIKRI